jgi:glutamine amidotransferase
MGNLKSIVNALNYLGYKHKIVDTPDEIQHAKKIILPGVGSFKQAMLNIKQMSLYDVIKEKVMKEKIPILGICLGMQLLGNSSTEDGFTKGLGFIDDEVIKFNTDKTNRIPHIGFNSVMLMRKSILFLGLNNKTDFYFVHSFRFGDINKPFVTGICEYGETFTASIEKENIFGTQFHPEKSQSNGLKLLINFAKI